LLEYLEGTGFVVRHHAHFPDHHAFRPAELASLHAHWQPGWPIFTTEKDATRLQTPQLLENLVSLPVYAVPVRVDFLGEGAAVLRQLLPATAGRPVVSAL
jgi:tetraacyldisaccharide 4'-kinase